MNPAERIQAASNFLLQSPPGEINDVLNDVRNIISDDDSLHEGVLPALRKYNLEQFMMVDVPGADHQTIVSEAARFSNAEDGEEERFLDSRSKTSYKFDHLSLEATDPQHVEPDAEAEPFRAAIESAALTYLAAHFQDGVSSVYSTPENPRRFVLQVVANKYNPSNFWAGRWRSEYIIDLNEMQVKGKILVNVHYYEQGNVQLATTHTVTIPLPSSITSSIATNPSTASSKILALIEVEESKYQNSLNDTYLEMGEKTFKGLRRALPMTRQKLEWEKVLGYKLGAELSASKGLFAGS